MIKCIEGSVIQVLLFSCWRFRCFFLQLLATHYAVGDVDCHYSTSGALISTGCAYVHCCMLLQQATAESYGTTC
jgi:hypothetical protein